MHRTVTVLWLIRADCIQLYPFRPLTVPPAATELASTAEQEALLDLLVAQPGVQQIVQESAR